MPAALDATERSRIAFYSALGYSQQEIGEELDISRTTVRKYRRKVRAAVENSDTPTETLIAILSNEYEWERSADRIPSFGDHPM